MKPIEVKDVFGEEVTVNDETKKLTYYNNKDKIIRYNAQLIENGELTGFWREFEVVGTIDNIEEKLEMFGNPVKHYYAEAMNFDAKKNDPEGKIWNSFVEAVKENESHFFTKKGDWRKYVSNFEILTNKD